MSGHAACAVGSRIFLYGGRQGSQVRKYLRRLYIYDTGAPHGDSITRILNSVLKAYRRSCHVILLMDRYSIAVVHYNFLSWALLAYSTELPACQLSPDHTSILLWGPKFGYMKLRGSPYHVQSVRPGSAQRRRPAIHLASCMPP